MRIVIKAWKNSRKVLHTNVPGQNFSNDATEVGRKRQIAPFVELVVVQAGPSPVDLPALNVAAHHEHAVRMSMVGAAATVFFRGAPEFAHRDKQDILHTVA